MTTLFTIGFTRSTARDFFTALTEAGVRKVLDIRLHNTSQLAGFAKKEDLRYFLHAIGGIGYAHLPQLAPSPDLFDAYKNAGGAWESYEAGFNALLDARRVDALFAPRDFEDACLLCACPAPDKCHRRLVAQYFADRWSALEVIDLRPQLDASTTGAADRATPPA